jgi:oligo-1,6-glucosidase
VRPDLLPSPRTTSGDRSFFLQIAGDFQELVHDHERIFAFVRRLGNQFALVALNFGNDDAIVQLDSLPLPWSSLQLEIGNYRNEGDDTITDGTIQMKGFEGRLYLSR